MGFNCGIVGLPNVGKSSILASVSRSLPKIANYPFTTLSPLVGKVRFIDEFEFTMADIPGIVQVVGHVHALRKGIFAPRF